MSTISGHSHIPRRAQEAGWMHPGQTRHMCFPPRSYPEGAGPGAIWRCHFPGKSNQDSCGTVWMAEGIMVLHDPEDWPTGGKGRTALTGPERWFVTQDSYVHAIEAKGGERELLWEIGQYDFESALDKINATLTILLQMFQGRP